MANSLTKEVRSRCTPCTFCGSKNLDYQPYRIVCITVLEEDRSAYGIYCKDCRAMGPSFGSTPNGPNSFERAIRAWNRREPMLEIIYGK